MQNTDRNILIKEIYNTWGCAWRYEDNTQTFTNAANQEMPVWEYGMHELPNLPTMFCDGYAVENLLKLSIGEIVKSTSGAYGGEKLTIRVKEYALAGLKKNLRIQSNTSSVQIWDDENNTVITEMPLIIERY